MWNYMVCMHNQVTQNKTKTSGSRIRKREGKPSAFIENLRCVFCNTLLSKSQLKRKILRLGDMILPELGPSSSVYWMMPVVHLKFTIRKPGEFQTYERGHLEMFEWCGLLVYDDGKHERKAADGAIDMMRRHYGRPFVTLTNYKSECFHLIGDRKSAMTHL